MPFLRHQRYECFWRRERPGPGPGVLTWTFSVMSETIGGINNPVVLTYTARISGASPNLSLTNRFRHLEQPAQPAARGAEL